MMNKIKFKQKIEFKQLNMGANGEWRHQRRGTLSGATSGAAH